ncbi:MAG: extracellular solute-binding protein [Chloroflexi bacterium]|nr:extracellular solute-binding protein [Chloroflexota bacterium]
MRKALLLVLAILALGVGVTAAQTDLESVDPTGVTVTYWHQFTNVQAETMTVLVEEFNSTNEYGITVEAIAQGNYNDIRSLVSAGIVSGELPNIAAGYANDAASYSPDGAAVDLRPFSEGEESALGDMADDFRSDLLPFNSLPSGEVIAWPHQTSAQVFVYNQTLLSELGFDGPPATWDEFKEQACAAANATGPNGEDIQGFPITTEASMFESWVASQGGVIFDGENYVFDSEPVANALQLYADLYAEGCAYIPAERFAEQADFNRGLNPFFSSSTAGFTFIVGGFEDSGYEAEWSVTTFPHAEGQEVLQVFVPSIILIGGTPEEQVASWLFLKSLITPEAGAQWSSSTGYFGSSRAGQESLTDESAFGSPQIFPYFTTANDILNCGVRLYSGPSISVQGTVRGLISEAIANVSSNGMPVAEAVEILQDAAEQALADSM